VTAFLLNRRMRLDWRATSGIVLSSLLVLMLLLVAVAIEGIVCLVMALIPAVPLALMGAALGREIALRTDGPAGHACIVMLVLPALAALDARTGAGDEVAVHEVRSAIEIAAPPETVWDRLIAFGAIPDQPEWPFRIGIACPQGARIEGRGVGAVRYCEFSTGPFVEPITCWDEPRRLSFDVSSQPSPMAELSPWDIHPPHLDGFLRSRRGEFRLIALPGGGTRLEGSTWYSVDIHPDAYWGLWADYLIRSIHDRVLRHVRRLAEGR
jgi:hypothetical protein